METRNYLDSTYLKTPAQSGLSEEETLKKVYDLAQEAVDNGLFAVMIRPQYVKQIKQFLSEKNSAVKVGTVIGFHEGTAPVYEKLKEAQQAIDDGADELDFVINYEAFKKGSLEALKFEFLRCTELCMKNNKVVKWIIEIAALTDEQIASITKNIVKWATISFTKEQLSNIFINSRRKTKRRDQRRHKNHAGQCRCPASKSRRRNQNQRRSRRNDKNGSETNRDILRIGIDREGAERLWILKIKKSGFFVLTFFFYRDLNCSKVLISFSKNIRISDIW